MKHYYIGCGQLQDLIQDKLRIIAAFEKEVQVILKGARVDAESETVFTEARRQLREQTENRILANATTIFNQNMMTIREGAELFTKFLTQSSPPELRSLMEETTIITDLVTLGASFFESERFPDSNFGLGSIDGAFLSIAKLKKAWKHVITIVLPNNYAKVRLGERFQVRFTAYDPLK